MSKFKFAIIGCGRIGLRHATLAKDFGELIGVCDIVAEKVNHFGELFGTSTFTNIEKLLLEIKPDIVVICTPNGMHAQHAILAMKSGAHVLCEKPMSIDVQDAKEMIEVSQQTSRHLLIVKQNRFNPPVQAIKKLLDENKLGRIMSFQINCFWNRNEAYYENSWHGTKSLDGGSLFTPFSHFIDLLYWYLGDIKSIQSKIGNFKHSSMIEIEDTGVVLFEMQCGALGTLNYTINANGKNMEGSIALFGEKGTVKIGGEYLNELSYQSIEGLTIQNIKASNPQNQYEGYAGSMNNHHLVYENLLNVIKHNHQPHVNMFEALKTVEIISCIYKNSN